MTATTRMRRRSGLSARARLTAVCLAGIVSFGAARAVSAEVIDRILAVVLQQPILLSDVNAAISLQLVPIPAPTGDPIGLALDRLIVRSLILSEVDRYQPPEPAQAEIDARMADIERRFGTPADLDRILAATGMTRGRLREYIRDDLRVTTYLNQRFAASAQPSEPEVLGYYREHPAEFTSGGVLQPFEKVSESIQAKLAQNRRLALINDWTASLRRRADVAVLYVEK
jgi:hypothetical protein